jgi:GT2 family glycosyltransferase
VYVANDGASPISLAGATVYNLPFDLGLSAKRNYLVQNVPSQFRYLLFVDDDMVFTNSTDIDGLKAALESNPELGLASGQLMDYGTTPRPYEAMMQWEDGGRTLRLAPVVGAGPCDLTQNFFLARRNVFADTGWRDELKLAEHVPFFMDLKASGWGCLHSTSSTIDHWPSADDKYSVYRRRQNQFQIRWMDDAGLTKVIRPNGTEILRSRLEDPDYWPWGPLPGRDHFTEQ